jgi:addiction module HigA family antidote
MVKNRMRPVHPGEVLREEYLLPLGMSANALAIALRIPAPRINDIVLERRAITPDTALRLSRYFGGDAEGWMNLQIVFDLKRADLAEGQDSRGNQAELPIFHRVLFPLHPDKQVGGCKIRPSLPAVLQPH